MDPATVVCSNKRHARRSRDVEVTSRHRHKVAQFEDFVLLRAINVGQMPNIVMPSRFEKYIDTLRFAL